MPIVRSLTLHLPGLENPEDTVTRLKSCSGSVKPWTLRITVPQTDCNHIGRLCDVAEKYGLLIHVGSAEELEKRCGQSFLHVKCPRLFASTVCTSLDCVERALEKLWSSQVEPDSYTRYAVLVGGPLITPYFPALSAMVSEPVVGLALRYADVFVEAVRSRGAKLIDWITQVYRSLESVARCVSAEWVYLDLSLSPWMEESVARSVEEAYGVRLDSVGGLYGVLEANAFIERLASLLASRGIEVRGFNEVMLAVAEDTYLDRLVGKGKVRLRDLLRYATACVAGLDMVAVNRSSVDPRQLARELWAVYTVKKRPLGVRVIVVDEEPGKPVRLERFGVTHVAYV